MSNLKNVEALIARGDLIAASHLLDARGATQSDNPRELVVASRLWCLRGRFADARELLDRALHADPTNVEALIERARLAIRLGDDAGADAWFECAWGEGAPGDDWMVDWIDVLLRLGKFDAARNIATVRCERAPEQAGTWFRLGLAHQQARHQLQALDAYRHAARIDPALPMLRNNMGAAHLELSEYDRAQPLFEQTLRDDPDNALAWTNLGTVLLKRGQIDDSLVAAERACALAPNYATALQTYSYVLREHRQWDGALAVAQRALALEPANLSLVWTLAMLQLLRGDYANGWRNHEARWSGSPELRDVSPNVPAPRWNGEPLEGKTLFVWGEQGHGDVMQFVRFVPLIAERVKREGGKLIYCCFGNLLPLLKRSLGGVADTIIAHDHRPLPVFDYHLPLCSLPLTLGVTLQDLPLRSGYLKADPDKVRAWRERLPDDGKLKVGLVWSGSRTHQRNSRRSVKPAEIAKAFGGIRGVEFFSLQVGADGEVEQAGQAGLRLTDHTEEFATYDDTAAFIENLDLVITVCTSVAHLAAGLGVPTWVLLDVNPHWLWMTERRDSPWYPTVTLYRQPAFGQWQPVLDEVAAQLAAFAGAPDPGAASRDDESASMEMSVH
ncbi:tetratricopeptide repeat protein [Paraburkholderia terricola]|uniref:Tfp pilus assembly protein PilF n=1 Tax=Paraburkholderia terricola TaxID=169427 RepID=A0A1M6PJR3_9BURK|nr:MULTISPECIES: tetratricopeptide repeat protein [Paraburkholderia]SDP35772.1 Tfp pilus assembly protein PilF [Paraburkholderia sediminicola]SHK08201.1 Tfp pilus assembly protein PilF [Paraburkholderia terricola]